MSFLRRAAASPTLIVIAAVAIRAGYAWQYQAHLSHRALSAIPFLFESGNIAHSIATGGGFASPFRVDTGPTAWMTPVYPYLLAGIMKLFGAYTFQSWAAAVAMNIVFSSLVCVLLFFAARRIGGIGLAAGAAWLWAIFPNAIQMTYQSLWDTSLSALAATTIFWATLRLAESRTLRAWIFYGLLWGFALMTNASLLSALPFFLGWSAFHVARALSPVQAARRAAVTLAVIVLCCLPWTIRNWRTFHAFVPLRSVLGLQLWCGNNPDAKVIWLGEHHPIHDQSERNRYIEMGEIAYMREKEHGAIQYILTHPANEARLIAGRFIMIWTAGTPTPLTDFLKSKSNWFRYVLAFNICVAIGTFAGLVVLFSKRSAYAFPAAVYPIIFPCAYYLTLALPRYRHPIEPVLILLTAVAVESALLQLRLRMFHRRALAPAEVVMHGGRHDQR